MFCLNLQHQRRWWLEFYSWSFASSKWRNLEISSSTSQSEFAHHPIVDFVVALVFRRKPTASEYNFGNLLSHLYLLFCCIFAIPPTSLSHLYPFRVHLSFLLQLTLTAGHVSWFFIYCRIGTIPVPWYEACISSIWYFARSFFNLSAEKKSCNYLFSQSYWRRSGFPGRTTKMLFLQITMS